MASDKRDRAYDFLLDFVKSSPKAAAEELLLACFNILSADDFVSMAEDEFGFEEEEEEAEDGDDPPDSWEDDARYEKHFLNEP